VIGLTPVLATARRLCLVWGVRSAVTDDVSSVEDMVEKADKAVRDMKAADIGDRVVVIAGIPFGRPGKTNMLRIFRVE
jgi:pyruvate kinase